MAPTARRRRCASLLLDRQLKRRQLGEQAVVAERRRQDTELLAVVGRTPVLADLHRSARARRRQRHGRRWIEGMVGTTPPLLRVDWPLVHVVAGSSRAAQRSLNDMEHQLIDRALDYTTVKYQAHWRQWVAFAHAMGWSAWLGGGDNRDDKRLRWFAVHCWKSGCNRAYVGNTYSTTALKLASIRWMHRRHVGIELASSPKLKLLMKGIKRVPWPTRKKYSITPGFLRLLHRSQFSRPSRAPTLGHRLARLLLPTSAIPVPDHQECSRQARR